MTKQRAQQILNMATYGSLKKAFLGRKGAVSLSSPSYHADGITEKEDNEIRALWSKLSGNTSYADVVRKLAKYGA
jgi:hypothetical protein